MLSIIENMYTKYKMSTTIVSWLNIWHFLDRISITLYLHNFVFDILSIPDDIIFPV